MIAPEAIAAFIGLSILISIAMDLTWDATLADDMLKRERERI